MSENSDNLDIEYKSAVLQGKKHEQNKEYDKAHESFERALGIKSDDPELWFDKGYVLWMLDRPEEAVLSFEQSVKINQSNPMSWYYKGLGIPDSFHHNVKIA